MIDLDAIRTLADIPDAQARARPDKIAIECEGLTLTYRDLAERTAAAAEALAMLGVGDGERVLWLGRNCEHFHVVYFACARLGACLTPLNYRLSERELAYIIDDSGARLGLVTDDRAAQAEAAIAAARAAPAILRVETPPTAWTAPAGAVAAPGEPRGATLQLYTSGTTGRPKGVCLDDEAYAALLEVSPKIDGFDYDSDDVVLCVMPLFHVAGFNVSTVALAHGCKLIIHDQFQPAKVLEAFNAHAVAQIFLAPAMIAALLAEPGAESGDYSRLRTIGYGASPISQAVLSRAQAMFGCGFAQFYGMTETAGSGSCLTPKAHAEGRLLSCGTAWPGSELEIRRPDGTSAGVGEVGEIVIRGPSLMIGYYNRAEDTRAAMTGGWMHTGDAGYRDADGYFFVHDRLKDMIVSGGENIYPAEVENAVAGCPGVADVAVIGVPSERWGEAVHAVVVRAPGEPVGEAEIIAHARGRIAAFKAPKAVTFVDTLPRNASGKVLRRQLREPFWRGAERQIG